MPAPVRDSFALLYGSVAHPASPFPAWPPFASLSGSVAPRHPACAACLTASVARPRWFATGSRWRGPVGAMDVGELLSYQVSSGGWALLGVSRSPALWPPARRCPRPWPRCGDAAPAPVRPRAWGGRRAGPARPHWSARTGSGESVAEFWGSLPLLGAAVLGGTRLPGAPRDRGFASVVSAADGQIGARLCLERRMSRSMAVLGCFFLPVL